MIVLYIEPLKTSNFFRRLFNKYIIKGEVDRIQVYLPINNQTSEKRVKKIVTKLFKFCYDNNICNCVLNKELMQNERLKRELYSNNFNILDGSHISRYIIDKMVEKIYEYKQKNIETGELTVLVNDNDDINMEIIKKLSQNIRVMNIITNDTHKFDNMLKTLYYEYGILIRITNNYNINLEESDVIINIDFPEETINKVRIPDRAIILNIPQNININSKRFSGINIKNWKIQVPERCKSEEFIDICNYEAELMR